MPSTFSLGKFSSFELICVSFKSQSRVNIVVIYRTGPYNNNFIHEFSELLVNLSSRSPPFLILGDFNMHLNKTDSFVKSFNELIDLFSLKQHVDAPTHYLGNTLDLILSNFSLDNILVSDPSRIISDHYLLNFSFSVENSAHKARPRKTIEFREINSIDVPKFNSDIALELQNLNNNLSLDVYVCNFFNSLNKCLDVNAPLICRTITERQNCEYFNDELRTLKRRRRACERRLAKAKVRKTNIAQCVKDHDDATLDYFERSKEICESSSLDEVSEANGDQRVLFNVVRKLTVDTNILSSNITAEDFSTFFSEKINTIRENIPPAAPIDVPPFKKPQPLNDFSLTSPEEISKLINTCKKTNTPSESFPSKLFPLIIFTILPYLLFIFNYSLRLGSFPDFFKHACVIPILKKSNLDTNTLKNYRPISLLHFMSKILERIVAFRIREHISKCNIDEILQSGYKSLHSTETALLLVTNHLRRAADKNSASILLNLDLSAAFDTLDHPALLDRLNKYIGLGSTALSWFRSYLSNRTQSVYKDGKNSDSAKLKYGVPQGSVLGPLLFLIYVLPLGILLRQLGLSFHFFADDTQIYITVTVSNLHDQVRFLQNAYNIISNFLSYNFLKLNPDKSEIMFIGKPNIVSQCKARVSSIKLGNADIKPSNTVKNLGVTFDEQLSFRDHIKNTAKSALFTLRNLKPIRNHFNQKGFETLMHAFITSKIDYCNSLFSGISYSSLRPLQLVQNYAARLVLRENRYTRATPLLRRLHWLPVPYRVDFKILLITYKCRNDLAPKYLTELIKSADHLHSLRVSDDSSILHIDFTYSVTMGDRAFSVYAPKKWNKLPFSLRHAESLEIFKKNLKTYLFIIAFDSF